MTPLFIENAHKIYPALFPEGSPSEDGAKWRIGTIEINLQGDAVGEWVDTAHGASGTSLFDLATATGRRYPELTERAGEILGPLARAKRDARSQPSLATPNGHDPGHAPPVVGAQSAMPNGHDWVHLPIPLPPPGANGLAKPIQPAGGYNENLPYWTDGKRKAAAGKRGKQEKQQEGRGLPIVKVGGGSLPASIDEAEMILIEHDGAIFQRGDFVVRPAPTMVTIADDRKTSALRLVPIKAPHMIERFTRFVDFQKYNAKEKDYVSINCPPNVASAYLERTGDWNLRVLSGIANAPTLRPDGSILDQPGYDAATGILYDPRGVDYPPIPAQPTKDGAALALEMLKALISEFPFVNDVDQNGAELPGRSASRSVAFSGILTAVIRRSIPHAPLHAFTAPTAGTGKSKLVDLASMIASGHEAPVLAQGKTEEEMEKRLGAALIAADTLISFDNCEQPLGGELLCQALTQPKLDIRILGKSVNKTVVSNAAMFATGNNLAVIGDMTRRTLVASLDAQIERPETRTFTTEDPIEVVRRHRAKFAAAALTILRAYHVAGRPDQGTIPLGSFETWSRWVRDALIWLGEPDPCATMERARAEDPRRQELAAVLTQWNAAIDKAVTVKALIDRATTRYLPGSGGLDTNAPGFLYAEFRESLLVVAGDGGVINSRRLGTWLGRNKGKMVGELRLMPDTKKDGENRWRVQSA